MANRPHLLLLSTCILASGLMTPARAAEDEPDLSLQVLSYKNDRLEFRLGSKYGPFYEKKATAVVSSGKKRLFALTMKEEGESGMGLTKICSIKVTATVDLLVETATKATFRFALDPQQLRKLAPSYEWIEGKLASEDSSLSNDAGLRATIPREPRTASTSPHR